MIFFKLKQQLGYFLITLSTPHNRYYKHAAPDSSWHWIYRCLTIKPFHRNYSLKLKTREYFTSLTRLSLPDTDAIDHGINICSRKKRFFLKKQPLRFATMQKKETFGWDFKWRFMGVANVQDIKENGEKLVWFLERLFNFLYFSSSSKTKSVYF